MIFYFIYEVLIKKYNVQLLKDIFDNSNDKKEYNLEEIVIKYPNKYTIKTYTRNGRVLLTPISETCEFELYNELDMIV